MAQLHRHRVLFWRRQPIEFCRQLAKQALDAGGVDGDDERRLSGVRRLQVEVLVRVGHEQADDDDAADVEQQNPDVHAANAAERRSVSGMCTR